MRIFTTQRDEINGRLDSYFYQPEFVELEKKIKKKTDKTLGDFVLGISGGATPNKLYSDKYYAKSADDGIPF
jgi:6-phosphogluconolactonase/glucosamine-6-phosphate isomerase/deaminase